MRLGVSLTASSTLTGVFNHRFEALFPHAGTLGCMVCLSPQLSLPVYLHANVGLPSPQSSTSLGLPATFLPTSPNLARPGPPAAALLRVLSIWLPVSTPPTGLDECFFFNSLVVVLPYSLIFCQFWLVFAFKFVVVLFWSCEEAQYVYPHLRLGRKLSALVLDKYCICLEIARWRELVAHT